MELKHGMKEEKRKKKKTLDGVLVLWGPWMDYARKKLSFRLSFPVKYIFPAAVLGVV